MKKKTALVLFLILALSIAAGFSADLAPTREVPAVSVVEWSKTADLTAGQTLQDVPGLVALSTRTVPAGKVAHVSVHVFATLETTP